MWSKNNHKLCHGHYEYVFDKKTKTWKREFQIVSIHVGKAKPAETFKFTSPAAAKKAGWYFNSKV